MAVHDSREFEQLFAAFTNGDVTTAERGRLAALAERDIARRGAIAEVEALHELVGVEQSMRESVMRPVDPKEESDEGYQRLSVAAAHAGETLRAKLMHSPRLLQDADGAVSDSTVSDGTVSDGAVSEQGATPRGSRWLLLTAMAAVVLFAVAIGLLLSEKPSGADWSSGKPGSQVLGGGVAMTVTQELSTASPEFLWSEVRGAARYEVAVTDAAGAVVLQRVAGRTASLRLDATDMKLLRSKSDGLFVAVVARTDAGEVAGSTRSRAPLVIR